MPIQGLQLTDSEVEVSQPVYVLLLIEGWDPPVCVWGCAGLE